MLSLHSTHTTHHAGSLAQVTSTTLHIVDVEMVDPGDLRMRGRIHGSNHDPKMRHLEDDISWTRYLEDGISGIMMETVHTWTGRGGGAQLRYSYTCCP